MMIRPGKPMPAKGEPPPLPDPKQMPHCVVFLRKKGKVDGRKGLGVHPFGRIPVAGEYIALGGHDGPWEPPTYKVTHVTHTGFGSHVAELWVIKADDVTNIAAEDFPPAP